MAYQVSDTKYFPSLAKLKTIEAEINMILKNYKTAITKSSLDREHRSFGPQTSDITNLTNLNNQANVKINEALDTLAKIYPQGVTNQGIVSLNQPVLQSLAKKLNIQQKELAVMTQQLDQTMAEKQTSELQKDSNQMQYFFGFLNLAWWIFALVVVYQYKGSLHGMADELLLLFSIYSLVAMTVGWNTIYNRLIGIY